MVHFPYRNLIPTFFAGLIDDPILLLRTRPNGRHLMFDCGQVHHLAKRTFTNLEAIFISHAHMDHWMGIDSVVRQLIAAGKTVDIFGGPGLADKFEHKLSGYDWNLAEDYWSSFRVHEIYPEYIRCALFSGADSFIRKALEPEERTDSSIYRNDYLEVHSAACDHRVPSQIFRIDENPDFRIDREQFDRLGVLPGPWLAELKNCHLKKREFPEQISVPRQDGTHIIVHDVKGLSGSLLKPQTTHSLGYISDVGFTPDNRKKIMALMTGVDLLISECTFLGEAKERARNSSHLCTEDVNQLLAELKPSYYLPMHLSRSYSRHSEELYRELAPPEETSILRLPLQLTPRPLLADEISWQSVSDSGLNDTQS